MQEMIIEKKVTVDEECFITNIHAPTDYEKKINLRSKIRKW